MSELSKTGGFVNADAAVELAATLKPEAPKSQDKKNKSSFQNNIQTNQ